jgi:hypothetical protein
VSGATTRPTITKIASSRQRWIEYFTGPVSHIPAHDGKRSSITKPRVSLTYASGRKSRCDESNPSLTRIHNGRLARTFFKAAT